MTPLLDTGNDLEGRAPMVFMSPSSSGMGVLPLDHRDPLVRVLLRVGQMRTLGQDWNSYGSAPPSESLVEFVEWFVTAADEKLSPFLPAPHAVPVSGGGIKLTWEKGERELELEFGPNGEGNIAIEFLQVSHGEPLKEGPLAVSELNEHLAWIIEG